MSDSPPKAAPPPLKERSACGKAALSQYPAPQPPILAPQWPVERISFRGEMFPMARASVFVPPSSQPRAFAQQAPLDLTSPAAGGAKVGQVVEDRRLRRFRRTKRFRAPTPGSMRRAS